MLCSKQYANIPFKQPKNVCPLFNPRTVVLDLTPRTLVALEFEIPVASSHGCPGQGKPATVGRTDVWFESYWQ